MIASRVACVTLSLSLVLAGWIDSPTRAGQGVAPAVPGSSSTPLLGLTETGCDDFTTANADFEAYGPTDVDAQAGDGRVTVGVNDRGTVTVFKWPNPSFYNQIKYVAVGRDAAGRAQAQYPNEGSQFGLRYRLGARTHFAWLSGWTAHQRYDSDDTAVPLTTYTSPRRLGLRVAVFDVAAGNALEREVWVTRSHRSPVRSAQLVAFSNFNPVANHIPYLPIADWCLSQASDQTETYVAASHSIVDSWAGTDSASGEQRSAAIAMGFDGRDAEHQVGRDGYDPAADASQPDDGYLEIGRGAHRLGGADDATGQTTATMLAPLRFDRHGRAALRYTAAAGATPAAALAALGASRRHPFGAAERGAAGALHRWLARTKLPVTGNHRVTTVAKRSLISLRLAMVRSTGAIVASADTQGPYGEDWIRDGAFMNEALDLNGFTAAVTRHDLFYARVQTSDANPSPLRPSGNWPMASYGDGVDGAPVPWEIDETGLGIWTLYRHALVLRGAARSRYLGHVYPAIGRSADWLVTCADPTTGLECPASEDDNYTPSQTLHGAETTVLGLKCALAAAALVHDRSARVTSWQARLATVSTALDTQYYDAAHHDYREGNSTGNAYNQLYEDGGWLLWPVQLKPAGSARMREEAVAVGRTMEASYRDPTGEYEVRGLLGLAHEWRHPTRAQSALLHRDLAYTAAHLTTRTGLFGEAWKRFSAGTPRPLEDMPHVWEHTLFYLSAVAIDGSQRYRSGGPGYLAAHCRTGAAPRAACRGLGLGR